MGNIKPEDLVSLVSRSIEGAKVEASCYSGDDHFEMVVTAAAFAGKSRVQRHKMVYEALGDNMRAAIHALALKTLTPEEAES